MQAGETSSVPGRRRIRRRDRHGRGLRGRLVPTDVPLYRSRAQQFDDLVLDTVARLEPRWEAELSGIEFAVQEVPDEEIAGEEIVPARWPGSIPARRTRSTRRGHGPPGSCCTAGRCWPGPKTRTN